MDKIPVIAVVGPTASGKTSLAVDIAKRYNGEVISADSMQIYKKMNIGTAKPTIEEMQGVPHHLIDCINLSENFNVADYASLAHKVIFDIHSRGKLPILVGGTGLYIHSVVDPVDFFETVKDDSVRAELTEIAQIYGKEKLFEMLCELDPEESQIIDKNNTVRLIRAIEVCRLTGGTMTAYKKRNTDVESRYNCLKIGINYEDRSELYDRINKRVDIMLEEGLLEEAKFVLESENLQTAIQAIGYKEFADYFAGKITLAQAVETIKQESRRYAKRQLTWFKRDKQIVWFYKGKNIEDENIQKNIQNCVDKFLQVCYY